ncbi:phosphoadenosine phosphosulfate reductase family protein [Delftia sp.]|nr:phosphoadenosine phosphosulfate reductase family protein [Delftia sp.]
MRAADIADSVGQAIAGRRAALHFSGGKDSLACLYLLRPLVEQGLPVYWLSTGDTIPETRAVVDQVRAWIPDLRTVQTDVLAWKAAHGIPSDVTTAQSS